MILVYVAGPYRAPHNWGIECNVRRAETLALEVWRSGHVALCPHTLSRFYQGTLPDATWLAGDLVMLERCDAVLLVEGWATSAGTRAEIVHARASDIPVFESLDELNEWTKRRGRRGQHAGKPAAPGSGVG